MNKDMYEIIKDVDSVLAEVMIGDFATKKKIQNFKQENQKRI